MQTIAPTSPDQKTTRPLTVKKLFLKSTLLSLVFLAIFFLITLVIVGLVSLIKFNTFAKTAEISKSEFISTIKTGWKQEATQDNNHKNILVLGLDSLETRGESLPLTDTMMLASINFESGVITTLPIPRDLWSDQYQTKINALYTYGLDRYPQEPEKFPQEVVSDLTSVPIHHVVVLSFADISKLVDLMGGIEVDVPTGFVDEQFPRPDVDVTTETDPAKLYERIEFEAGPQTMSGETALKYIRSRYSESEEGTDLARSERQQLVINSLMSSLRQRKNLTNAKLMGDLYKFYQERFNQYLSIEEITATGKALLPVRKKIEFQTQGLSIYPDDKTGVITHPPTYLYQGQWVYVVQDSEAFQQEVQTKLLK